MGKIKFALFSSFLLILSSCVSNNTIRDNNKNLPNINQEVLNLLPKGSFEVEGIVTNNENQVTNLLYGYVYYGDGVDGTNCEADYLLSNLKLLYTPKETRNITNSNGNTWFYDTSLSDGSIKYSDPADPSSVNVILLFIPYLISSDFSVGIYPGAGTGLLCSLPIISRFMYLSGDKLLFDTNRAIKISNLKKENWNRNYLDSKNISKEEQVEALKDLNALTFNNNNIFFENLKNYKIVISNKGNKIILSQYEINNNLKIEFVFTPTEKIIIDNIKEKKYFEKLKAGEIKDVFLDGK